MMQEENTISEFMRTISDYLNYTKIALTISQNDRVLSVATRILFM